MLRQDAAPADTEPSIPAARRIPDAVHVRNYDHAVGHSVRVTASDADGQVRLSERSYLPPGQSESVAGELPPGEYRLAVRVDGVDRRIAGCVLGAASERTALVELGNGAVSVTQGPDQLTPT